MTPAGPRTSTSRILSGGAKRVWQVLSVLSIAVLTWWYIASRRQPSANGYHGITVVLGWIGIVLVLLATALSARKRFAYQGIGKLSEWMNAHTYFGVVAAFVIAYHAAFRAGGPLTAWLLAFFYLTVASGLLGWILARKLPPILTAIEESPAIMEDVLEARAECVRGMLELAAGGSSEFRFLVEHDLMKETASWGRMWRFYRRQSMLAQELPAFQNEYEAKRRLLRESEQRAFQRAVEYALRANKMNTELFLQRLLRGWLTLHMVSTSAMLGLAAIHIVAVLYY